MSYYVSLGGINITGVKDISLTSGRDMQEYDGIGNGKFSVPESENLREWTISCELSVKNIHKFDHWQAAGYVFTAFETMLKTKDYSRFISVSSAENISELVRLKQYTKKEKYDGVYDVEITLQEYKAVAIKTTGVPYIARPGKVPVPPKVVIKKSGDVYKSFKKTGVGTKTDAKTQTKETGLYSNPFITRTDWKTGKKYLIEPKTGKPVVNPNTVKSGTAYKINGMATTSVVLGDQTESEKWIADTFNSIGKAIGNFLSSSSKSQKRGMV